MSPTYYVSQIYLDDVLVLYYLCMISYDDDSCDKEFYAVNKPWLDGNNQTTLIFFGTLCNVKKFFLVIHKFLFIHKWIISKYECRSELSCSTTNCMLYIFQTHTFFYIADFLQITKIYLLCTVDKKCFANLCLGSELGSSSKHVCV